MADRVQFILDRMAPVFREMENLGVFAKDEVKSIVKQRTDFEYVLRRRQQSPADYYKYLQYELNLEELRTLRCFKRSQSTSKEVQHQFRKLQSAFMRHICYVFERGLRRFPDNMDLWNDYISFLKEKKAHNILNTVFGRALSLHPKNENLWLQASMFELQSNANLHAARVLLQRSLRFNPDSEVLWLRYFELELWHIARVAERRDVLGLSNEAEGPDLALGTPLVVYRHAVSAAVPSPLSFSFSFLDSCKGVAPSLEDHIRMDMRERFGSEVAYWVECLHRMVAGGNVQSAAGGKRPRGTEGEDCVVSAVECLESVVALLREAQNFCEDFRVDGTSMRLQGIYGDIIAGALKRLCLCPDLRLASLQSDSIQKCKKSKKGKSGKVVVENGCGVSNALSGALALLSGVSGTAKVDMHGDCLIALHMIWLCYRSLNSSEKSGVNLNDLIQWLEMRSGSCDPVVWVRVARKAWETALGMLSISSSHLGPDPGEQVHGLVDRLSGLLLKHANILLSADCDHYGENEGAGSSLLLHCIEVLALKSTTSSTTQNSDDSDSDEEVIIQPKQCVITSALRNAFLVSRCRPEDRVLWACRYVRMAAATGSIISFRDACEWMESAADRMPLSMAGVNMTSYYRIVCNLEMNQFRNVLKVNGLKVARQEAVPVRKRLEKAIEKTKAVNDDVDVFYDMLGEMERSIGNHKVANHMAWRKKVAY
mmetsp:Transcript_1536/g.2469  ORF Transcript_1536/g.2469 Transcript_1536/m.2469 type:complete len:710 (+) Transcript_1536:96-2225(+)